MNLLLLSHCLPSESKAATLFSFDEFNFFFSLRPFICQDRIKINKPTVTTFYTQQTSGLGCASERSRVGNRGKKHQKNVKDLNNFFEICFHVKLDIVSENSAEMGFVPGIRHDIECYVFLKSSNSC